MNRHHPFGFTDWYVVALFLAIGWGSVGAVVSDTVLVGSLYQAEVVLLDPASTPQNIIPVYGAQFRLRVNPDSSITKVWSLRDNPRKYYANGDVFSTPATPVDRDTSAYPPPDNYCKPGYRCLMLSMLDEGITPVGAEDLNTGTNTIFFNVYFYYPRLRFFDQDSNEITAQRVLNARTGDYVRISVVATTPNGKVAEKFTSRSGSNWLVPLLGGSSSALKFYSIDNQGNPSAAPVDSILMTNGRGEFFVRSDAPINGGGLDFYFSMYTSLVAQNARPRDTVHFPGLFNIQYGDHALMDSAAIYDLDGDGLGDHIRAWFNQTLDIAPRNPIMSWPNGDSALTPVKTSGAAIAFTSGAQEMEVDVDERTVYRTPSTGRFGVEVRSESGQWFALEAPLKDRIGPVITAATLLPGRQGATDTLIIRFNKAIDSAFTAGSAFLVNGVPVRVSGEPVGEQVWRFVVDPRDVDKVSAGDSIRIAVNGGIVSADGNMPAANNRPVVIRESGAIPPLSQNGNGFYDSDLDGRLDSIVIRFLEPLQAWQLDSMDLRFYWKDTSGNPIELKPDPTELIWSPDRPTQVSWKVDPDRWAIMYYLTSVNDDSYGYGNLIHRWEINGEVFHDTLPIAMTDRMAPVLMEARIWPVSKDRNKGDSLALRFSESVDVSALNNMDFLAFLLTGDAGEDFGVAQPQWSDSGRVLGVRLGKGVSLWERPNPGDSVRIKAISGGIADRQGNVMAIDGNPVLLQGSARVLVDNAFILGVNRLAIGGPDIPRDSKGEPQKISVDFWDDHVQLRDGLKGRSLGILLDVGMATIGDLDSTTQAFQLDLAQIGLSWRLDIFTNLGNFVASSQGKISCADSVFSATGRGPGNCYENRKRVYISWNMLAENGRKVGYGVYVAKLTLTVNGMKKPYRLIETYRWGVRPGSGSGRAVYAQ